MRNIYVKIKAESFSDLASMLILAISVVAVFAHATLPTVVITALHITVAVYLTAKDLLKQEKETKPAMAGADWHEPGHGTETTRKAYLPR